MKIVMIGHKYVPSREGGVEIVVEELATRMAAQGHEVTLFNRNARNIPPSPNIRAARSKTSSPSTSGRSMPSSMLFLPPSKRANC